MHHDFQIDAIRMALTLHETRARLAGVNIANANRPGAHAVRADVATARLALAQAFDASGAHAFAHWLHAAAAALQPSADANAAPIRQDREIAEMAAASADYQALTETLARHFALMRLAIAGRT